MHSIITCICSLAPAAACRRMSAGLRTAVIVLLALFVLFGQIGSLQAQSQPGHNGEQPIPSELATLECEHHHLFNDEFELIDEHIRNFEWDQALSQVRALEQHMPDCPLLWYYLGRTHYYLHRDSEALTYFNRIATSFPLIHQTYHYRGLIFVERGNRIGALTEFMRVFLVNHRAGTGYFYQTVYPLLVFDGEFASEKADSVISLANVIPADHLIKGFIHYLQEEYSEAADHLLVLVEQQPDHAGGWFYLARSYDMLNRTRRSLNAFDKVLALDREFAGAWFYRGLSLLHNNDPFSGCNDLYEAVQLEFPGAANLMRIHCQGRRH